MKILCAGNRYIEPDGAALWLYDRAVNMEWPEDCCWIEAGLGGLNLLPHFETTQPIWLLDYMPDYPNASLHKLEDIVSSVPVHYQHDTALRYLLSSLPVLFSTPPTVTLMSCNPEQNDWQDACLETVKRYVEDEL